MKPLSKILPPIAALIMTACASTDDTPMLRGHVAENDRDVTILLYRVKGSERFDITPDAEGDFHFSPTFQGHGAEITISHNAAEFGAYIEEGKTSRLTIADRKIVFTGDNKEINEFCNSFQHLLAKDNFKIDENESSSEEAAMTDRLEKAATELRQILATVSDNVIREKMAERLDTVYCHYLNAIRDFDTTHDASAYNKTVESIDMLHGMAYDGRETAEGTLTAKLRN